VYYVYECEHVGRVFGCESGMGLGCDRAQCKNCGGRMTIWQGDWGLFERRHDGEYTRVRALATGADWKAMRTRAQARDQLVLFLRDKMVAIGVSPAVFWVERKAKKAAGQRL
jgi:hypothetical protein